MKPNPEVTVVQRPSASGQIEDWCYFGKSGDQMEVCEWGNSEGFDVNISTQAGEINIKFTWGEWQLLKTLVRALG